MIIYATKQTFERYKLKLPAELTLPINRITQVVNFVTCFAKLTDKSAIVTLNTTQSRFADDGYRFYEFIRGGILHSMEINHDVNFKWLFTMKTDGKTEYFYVGEKCREIVLDRYGKS